MTTAYPHVAPDPFDDEIEAMLRDPELIADLDVQHAELKRGELEVHGNGEARHIVGLEPESRE